MCQDYEAAVVRRFYKTGDLVKYNNAGEIIYLGRKDTQIKIHGQRVEIGEIEHHITAFSITKHTAVAYPTSGPFAKCLVAILSFTNLSTTKSYDVKVIEVVNDARSVDIASKNITQLRRYLEDKVPQYMVPRYFVVVETVPLSPTGKIDRKKFDLYLTEASNSIHQHITRIFDGSVSSETSSEQPRTREEKFMQSMWSQTLNVSTSTIGLNSSFLRLGGDSISALQLLAKCRQEGVKVSVQEILRRKNLAELARSITVFTQSVHHEIDNTKEDNHSFGLSPIQQQYFESAPHGENLFTQSYVLRCKRQFEANTLLEAVSRLVGVHDMLRTVFQLHTDGKWVQSCNTSNQPRLFRFEHYQVSSLEDAKPAAENIRNELDIRNGPVFAAVILDCGIDRFILLIAHHLIVDLVSWRIIIQDLEDTIRHEHQSLPSTTTFRTWCRIQESQALNIRLDMALPLSLRPSFVQQDWGMAGRPNINRDVLERTFEIESYATSLLLGKCNESLNTEPLELFHAGILGSFHRVFGYSPSIFYEGHGREPIDDSIDLSRTVGWFTTIYPVNAQLDTSDNVYDIVRIVKDVRRSIPNNGQPYFAARFLHPKGRKSFGYMMPEILLNYHGRFQQVEREDALFEVVSSEILISSDRSSDSERPALINIEIWIENGRLKFQFEHNQHMAKQKLLLKWIDSCKEVLLEIVRYHEQQKPRYTKADFPLFKDDYTRLQSLLNSTTLSHRHADIVELYPASPMQQELLQSQSKGCGYYEGTWLWEVSSTTEETVDSLKLHQAWEEVVKNHAILRTVFLEQSQEPTKWYQVVLRSPPVNISEISASSMSGARDRLRSLQAFDYAIYNPLHRLTICTCPDGVALCRLDISHAISDGTAMDALLLEWIGAYQSEENNVLKVSPDFRGYIDYLESDDRQAQYEYWRSYIWGIENCHFPLNRSPDLDDRRLQQHSLAVELPQGINLIALCDRAHITLASLLRFMWAVLLHKYVGLDNVSFGYLVYGRDVPIEGADKIMGPLFNTLICRAVVKSGATLIEGLQAMQDDYIEGFPYQNYSFAELQRAVKDSPLLQQKRPFNTLVNHRRAVRPHSTNHLSLSFKELECLDPMEVGYKVIL